MGNCFSCLHSKSTTRPQGRFGNEQRLDNVPDKRVEGEFHLKTTLHFLQKLLNLCNCAQASNIYTTLC